MFWKFYVVLIIIPEYFQGKCFRWCLFAFRNLGFVFRRICGNAMDMTIWGSCSQKRAAPLSCKISKGLWEKTQRRDPRPFSPTTSALDHAHSPRDSAKHLSTSACEDAEHSKHCGRGRISGEFWYPHARSKDRNLWVTPIKITLLYGLVVHWSSEVNKNNRNKHLRGQTLHSAWRRVSTQWKEVKETKR